MGGGWRWVGGGGITTDLSTELNNEEFLKLLKILESLSIATLLYQLI